MTTILDENELDDIVLNVMEEPTTNAGRLSYKTKQGKARRGIYNSIREELMPNITSLKTAKECYDTLVNLYEKKTPSQKRFLKKRLRNLKLKKDESVGSFFTKIIQVRLVLLLMMMILYKQWLMVSQGLGKPSWHLSVDVRINQLSKDFGMIA